MKRGRDGKPKMLQFHGGQHGDPSVSLRWGPAPLNGVPAKKVPLHIGAGSGGLQTFSPFLAAHFWVSSLPFCSRTMTVRLLDKQEWKESICRGDGWLAGQIWGRKGLGQMPRCPDVQM